MKKDENFDLLFVIILLTLVNALGILVSNLHVYDIQKEIREARCR